MLYCRKRDIIEREVNATYRACPWTEDTSTSDRMTRDIHTNKANRHACSTSDPFQTQKGKQAHGAETPGTHISYFTENAQKEKGRKNEHEKREHSIKRIRARTPCLAQASREKKASRENNPRWQTRTNLIFCYRQK